LRGHGRDYVRYGVALPVVAWITFHFAYGILVTPLASEWKALDSQLKETRTKSAWAQGWNEKCTSVEKQLEIQAPLEHEIAGYLVREADTIRIGEARDRALRDLEAVFIPQDAARPGAFNFETAEDLDRELSMLKKGFQETFYKGSSLANWTARSMISIQRIDETFGLECPHDSVLKFIARIESSAPFLEVTKLRAQGLQVQGGKQDKVHATVTISALAFPQEEDDAMAGARGQ
jgi:hypothetical protein